MRAFDGAGVSIPHYRAYLALQLQIHAPLEAALAPWLPAGWVALRLSKSAWLRNDLRSLGHAAKKRADRSTDIESWAQALGVLYVLEGSTLGLQVVRKKLHDTHPALSDAGRFMLGYGPDTGRHWREFLEQLELLPKTWWPHAEDAAIATFDTFLNRFARVEFSHA